MAIIFISHHGKEYRLTRGVSTLHCRLEPIGEGIPHNSAAAAYFPPFRACVGASEVAVVIIAVADVCDILQDVSFTF